MKKLLLVLLLALAGAVYAEGDKNQGETGTGETSTGGQAQGQSSQDRSGR